MIEGGHLNSSQDIDSLKLVGARLSGITVTQHSVDLLLSFDDLRSATVRIESGASLTSADLKGRLLSAGPELAVELLQLIGGVITGQDTAGLDLGLEFGRTRTLWVLCDRSGFESYEITIDGKVYVAATALPGGE